MLPGATKKKGIFGWQELYLVIPGDFSKRYKSRAFRIGRIERANEPMHETRSTTDFKHASARNDIERRYDTATCFMNELEVHLLVIKA